MAVMGCVCVCGGGLGGLKKLGKKMELRHLRDVSDPIFPLGYIGTNPSRI